MKNIFKCAALQPFCLRRLNRYTCGASSETPAAFHRNIHFDKVDKILAEYYGLNDEELNYILEYDFKYRVGDKGAAIE